MNFTGVEFKHRKRVTFTSSTDTSDSSSETSGTATDDHNSDEFPPIAKPSGEAGRPHSGGYNLEDTLALPKDTYEALVVSTPVTPYDTGQDHSHHWQKSTHAQAAKILDLKASYIKQRPLLIQEICNEVSPMSLKCLI
jgi:hypothetical protein